MKYTSRRKKVLTSQGYDGEYTAAVERQGSHGSLATNLLQETWNDTFTKH